MEFVRILKNVLLLAIAGAFIMLAIGSMSGCYVDSSIQGGNNSELCENNVKSFFNFNIISQNVNGVSCEYIVSDSNTNVLYYYRAFGDNSTMVPIMEADGTSLTYDEWKLKQETSEP